MQDNNDPIKRKELFDYFKSENLTDLDFDAFSAAYSSREKSDEIYEYLLSRNLTEIASNDFYLSYFGDVKQTPNVSENNQARRPKSQQPQLPGVSVKKKDGTSLSSTATSELAATSLESSISKASGFSDLPKQAQTKKSAPLSFEQVDFDPDFLEGKVAEKYNQTLLNTDQETKNKYYEWAAIRNLTGSDRKEVALKTKPLTIENYNDTLGFLDSFTMNLKTSVTNAFSSAKETKRDTQSQLDERNKERQAKGAKEAVEKDILQKKYKTFLEGLNNPEQQKKIEQLVFLEDEINQNTIFKTNKKLPEIEKQINQIDINRVSLSKEYERLENKLATTNYATKEEQVEDVNAINRTGQAINTEIKNRNRIASEAKAQIDESLAIESSIGSLKDEVSLLKKSYEFGDKTTNMLAAGISEIGSNLLYSAERLSALTDVSGANNLSPQEVARRRQAKLKQLQSEALNRRATLNTFRENTIPPSVELEKISSFGDFGEFAYDALIQTTPTLAQLLIPKIGIASFAVSQQASNELNIRQRIIENKVELDGVSEKLNLANVPLEEKSSLLKRKAQLEAIKVPNELEVFGVSAGLVAVELGLMQLGTIRLLGNLKRAAMTGTQTELKTAVSSSFLKKLGVGTVGYTKDVLGEGVEEGGITLATNLADMLILGENYNQDGSQRNIADGTLSATAGGLIVGGVLSGTTSAVGFAAREIADKNARTTIVANTIESEGLLNNIDLINQSPFRTQQEKSTIIEGYQNRLTELNKQNAKIINTTFDAYDNMRPEDKRRVLDISNESTAISMTIFSLSKNIDNAAIEDSIAINSLNKRQTELESEKTNLLRASSPSLEITENGNTIKLDSNKEIFEKIADDNFIESFANGLVKIELNNNEEAFELLNQRVEEFNRTKNIVQQTIAQAVNTKDTFFDELENEEDAITRLKEQIDPAKNRTEEVNRIAQEHTESYVAYLEENNQLDKLRDSSFVQNFQDNVLNSLTGVIEVESNQSQTQKDGVRVDTDGNPISEQEFLNQTGRDGLITTAKIESKVQEIKNRKSLTKQQAINQATDELGGMNPQQLNARAEEILANQDSTLKSESEIYKQAIDELAPRPAQTEKARTQAPANTQVNETTQAQNTIANANVQPTTEQSTQQEQDNAVQPTVEPTTSAAAVEELIEVDEFDVIMNGEAQKRRLTGTYTKDGVVFTRQNSNTKNPKGSSIKIRFADNTQQEVQYQLIEAENLQPSHLSGNRNPNFFITEAQPKNRRDQASQKQSDKIASDPNFEELGGNSLAYSGAPVVNERGEVIQGNNRSEGLKKHYNSGSLKYKSDLEANAEQFGFTKNQVAEMKNPVLVRVANVSDAKSIELGNFDVKDIETGGKRRIDPVATSSRLPRTVKQKITEILFQNNNDQTLNNSIRENIDAVIGVLKNYLNDAQLSTLINKNGDPNPEGIKDISVLIEHFLFEDGDSNLPELFESLSFNAKEGILKSLPKILTLQPSKSILKELQTAIIIYNEFSKSGIANFNEWLNQSDVFNEGQTPSTKYDPLDLAVAKVLLESKKQEQIRSVFNEYARIANGSPGDMFTESSSPKTKKETVKEIFKTNIQNENTKTNTRTKNAVDEPSSRDSESKTKPKAEKPNSKKIKNVFNQDNIKDDLDFLDGLKIDLNASFATIPFAPQVWNAFIEALKIARQAGNTIQKSVEIALDELRKLGTSNSELKAIGNFFSKNANVKINLDFLDNKKSNQGNKTQTFAERVLESENTSNILKKKLSKLDINYTEENQALAEDNANQIIAEIGIEQAYKFAKEGVIRGGARTYIEMKMQENMNERLNIAIEENDNAAMDEISTELSEIYKKYADEKRLTGQEIAMLNRIYKRSSIQFTVDFVKQQWQQKFESEIPAALVAKLKKQEQVIKDLEKEVKKLEKERGNENEATSFKNIKQIYDSKRNQPSQSSLRKASRALRKHKFTSTVNDLSTLQSSPLGLVTAIFDGAIETIATALDAGATLSEAVNKGVNEIKNTDWYKGLSKDSQNVAINKIKLDVDSFLSEEIVIPTTDGIEQDAVKIPPQLLYDLIATGIDNIGDLTRAVQEIIKEDYPNLTEREVRDAITKYGTKINDTKSDIEKILSSLKIDGNQLSKLEDLGEGKRPLKRSNGVKYTKEQSQKIREIQRLLRKLPIDDSADTESHYKSALESYKTRLSNRLEELKKAVKNSEIIKNEKSSLTLDDDAKNLKEEVARVQKEYDIMFSETDEAFQARVNQVLTRKKTRLNNLLEMIEFLNIEQKEQPKSRPEKVFSKEISDTDEKIKQAQQEYSEILEDMGIAESKRVERALAYINTRINNYQERLRKKDFAKSKPRPLVSDPIIGKAKQKLLEAKNRFQEELEKEERKNRTKFQKAYDFLFELWNIPKGTLASFDFSAMFRQGIMLGSSNPREYARATKVMHKAISEDYYNEFVAKIENSKYFPLMMESLLEITDTSGKINKSEEYFISNLTKTKIKIAGKNVNFVGIGLEVSERAYSSFLNSLRADVFIKGVDILEIQGQSPATNPKAYKDLAKVINYATGRGKLTKDDNVNKLLNAVFFSPRMITGMFGLLTMASNPTTTKYARTQALKSLATFVGYQGLIKLLLGSAFGLINSLFIDEEDKEEVVLLNLDPRETDFNKIKIGNTRYDTSAGWGVALRTAARFITSEKSSNGVVTSLNEGFKSNSFDEVTNFFKNKLSPSARFLYNYKADNHPTDIYKTREEATTYDYVQALFVPLTISSTMEDVSNSMDNKQGSTVAKTTFNFILNTYGINSMTYGEKLPSLKSNQMSPPKLPTLKSPPKP